MHIVTFQIYKYHYVDVLRLTQYSFSFDTINVFIFEEKTFYHIFIVIVSTDTNLLDRLLKRLLSMVNPDFVRLVIPSRRNRYRNILVHLYRRFSSVAFIPSTFLPRDYFIYTLFTRSFLYLIYIYIFFLFRSDATYKIKIHVEFTIRVLTCRNKKIRVYTHTHTRVDKTNG